MRGIQIKTAMTYHFIATGSAIIIIKKNKTKHKITSVGKGAEKSVNIAGGNVKWFSHFGKGWQVLENLNIVSR